MPTVNGQPIDFGCYIDGGRDTVEGGSFRAMEIAADLLTEDGEHGTELSGPIRHELDVLRFRLRNAEEIGDPETIGTVCEHIAESADDAVSTLNDFTEGGYWSWEDGDFGLWSSHGDTDTDGLCDPADGCEECDHFRSTGEEL